MTKTITELFQKADLLFVVQQIEQSVYCFSFYGDKTSLLDTSKSHWHERSFTLCFYLFFDKFAVNTNYYTSSIP